MAADDRADRPKGQPLTAAPLPGPLSGPSAGARSGSAAAHGPIAYLTGEYPKVSHTFILREIRALEALGLDIRPLSVRRAPAKAVVGVDQEAEARRTWVLQAAAKNPVTLIGAHLALLIRRPGAWLRAARLARATCPPGAKEALWQVFYFLQAAVLVRHLQAIGAVHLHNHFANSSCSVTLLASEMSGIPFSFTMHGPSEFFEAEKWRLDVKVARAAFVAAISHYCRSQLMYFSPRAHWDRIRIVHCGIEPARYGTAPRSAETAGKRIAFVGRLDAVKGAVLLLEAFAGLRARHPEARLVVIGDGPDRADIEARATELGLGDRVDFLGYRPQEEVAALLEQADMLVLPSFAEGVPVVLMEAMASRIPAVSTVIAGIPELIEDGVTGRLLAPGDVAGLEAALDALLSDPGARVALGARGREKVVAEFDLAAEAAWLAQIFAGSLAGTLPAGLRPEGRTPTAAGTETAAGAGPTAAGSVQAKRQPLVPSGAA